MNILFVCKHNRFRSQVAEAVFSKITKEHQVKSAGLIIGYPVSKRLKELLKEFDLKIMSKPKGLSSELINWADLIIVVANDVPIELFKGKNKKVKVWKIVDESIHDKEKIKKKIVMIKNKVEKLIKTFK